MFSESSLLQWQGCIDSVIRSAKCSTGCCSTTLRSFSQNMSHALKESMDISVRLSKRSWTSTWTVAIRSVGLQEFDAESVGKYMIRPILSLQRLSFDETEGQLLYQYDKANWKQNVWII